MGNRSGDRPPSFGPPGEADQVVSRSAFVAGSVMIFILIAASAAFFGTRAIQGDLEARTERALRIAGFQGITAAVTGFDVTLQGYYLETQSGDDATAAVAALNGVGKIDTSSLFVVEVSDIDPIALSGRVMTFAWANGTLTISGDVSTEAIQSYLETEPAGFADEEEQALFISVDASDVVVIEDLARIEGLADDTDWIGNAVALLRSLAAGLDEGELIINPSGKVVLTSGEVETRQEKRDITDEGEAATLALEADGFQVIPGLILPPDVPVATAEEVEELTQTLTELIGDKVVEFELNRADLTDEGKTLLDEILLSLLELPHVAVEIAGHADVSGTPEHNLDLSERRAQAVLDYFVTQGESPDRFIVVGYGDTQPVSPTATAEQNRRIEFIPQEG
ncbi:MAG: OmpA family protein [Acidobacteria bacterium]|nr:OmpA family protein [Acidobacteriota bacterium]